MLSKKRFLIVNLLIIFLFSSLTFANNKSNEENKNVVLASWTSLITLDPYNGFAIHMSAIKSFYEGLFEFDKDLKIKNKLALSYEISKDDLIYTFKLRPNVKFHDGTNFNAEAVKFNFERAKNPDNKLLYFNQFKIIDKIEVLDELNLKITLKEPIFNFIKQLASHSAVIISPTALKKYKEDIKSNPIGTGPFIFEEWQPREYLKVKKNPNYWDKSKPKIDSLTFLTVTDDNTRANLVLNGDVHFAFPIPYELIKSKQFIKNKNLEFINHKNSNRISYLSINVLKKPFDNIKIRQAINYAINKKDFIKVVYNDQARILNGLAPLNVDFSYEMNFYPHDIKKAKKLLKEAGFENGFETKLWTGGSHGLFVKAVQFIQQQLAQVGIKAKVEILEPAIAQDKIYKIQKPEDSQVELIFNDWTSSEFNNIDWILRPLFTTSSFPPNWYNNSYYSNSKVDDLVAEALLSNKKDEKAKLYKEAQEIIYKDAPAVFLVSQDNLYLKSKKLTGVFVSPFTTLYFNEIDLKE